MDIPRNLKYTETHEWIRIEEETAVIGITDYAQAQLSDVTYVELPTAGDTLSAGDEAGVVESVKAASDIYSPVDGTVTEINEILAERPEVINSDPYGEGWMYKIRISDPDAVNELIDADRYEKIAPDED